MKIFSTLFFTVCVFTAESMNPNPKKGAGSGGKTTWARLISSAGKLLRKSETEPANGDKPTRSVSPHEEFKTNSKPPARESLKEGSLTREERSRRKWERKLNPT
jgi:hypothetical protein